MVASDPDGDLLDVFFALPVAGAGGRATSVSLARSYCCAPRFWPSSAASASGAAGRQRWPRRGSRTDSAPEYIAPETEYRRAHAESRFAGDLDRASATSYGEEVAACGAPPDAYVLFDDGSMRAWRETGRSLLVIAGFVGAIALIAFLASLRKQPE